MDLSKLIYLNTENLVLKQVSINDKQFISEMFNDNSVCKNYIVSNETQKDYRNLVSEWLQDIKQEAGFAWIIIEKGSGLFSRDKSCGFIAFEFRNSIQNARISYALKPEHRGKGIITKCATLVIEELKSFGVTSIEADIFRDNIPSENIVVKLGFTTNKRQALVDPDMIKDGEIRSRYLWKKDLKADQSKLIENKIARTTINATQAELIVACDNILNYVKSNGKTPELVAKYLYLQGRIKFNEGVYEEAFNAFGDCNMVNMDGNLPENHETFYWFARIHEINGDKKAAKMYYEMAIEKYSNNPELIDKDEIIRALQNFN